LSRQHRITIKEIAAMCGVSTQTVSRVINKRPDVSPETRAAVEAAIASVGFQPSAVARSLVQRRSQTIGVVVAGLKYFGVAQTLNGITEESEASGYALLLKELASYDDGEVIRVVEFLLAHRVEGIIFVAPEMGTNIAIVGAQLPTSYPPIVFLKSEPSATFSTIMIDNYGGARLATNHLLALGRRRIAHLAGPLAWREARARREGWRDALLDAGVEPGPMVPGNWSSASGEVAFEQMLELAPDLDAVFAGNDQMALGIFHVAHRRGLAIPNDLAVVGFDGLVEGAQFTPSLTTISQPLGELGQLAVREMLRLVANEPAPGITRSATLATELIIRESAPAAANTTTRRSAGRGQAASTPIQPR
jgi:DNA-binding LacI/PurR family transcriptional regulator